MKNGRKLLICIQEYVRLAAQIGASVITKLNPVAEKAASKYIRQTSPENMVDSRKKRGLQAEINKMDSIRKLILNSKVDNKELLRFKAEVNKLLYVVENQLTPV